MLLIEILSFMFLIMISFFVKLMFMYLIFLGLSCFLVHKF